MVEDAEPEVEIEDDSDVPLAEVQAHQEEVAVGLSTNPLQLYSENESGGLSSTAGAEDVLVESVEGQVLDVTPDSRPQGRGHRLRRRNFRYNHDDWLDNNVDSSDEELE